MMYRHADQDNHEDFAAGRVLLHAPGLSHFPVRLTCEVFARCLERFPAERKIRLYDPCCGSGYLLAVLGFHFPERLMSLCGSDIDPAAVHLARQNLSLLSEQGLEARMTKLRSMLDEFGKESHKGALESAGRLLDRVRAFSCRMPVMAFEADIGSSETIIRTVGDGFPVDVVFADVPHQRLADWQGPACEGISRVDSLLNAVAHLLVPDGIVVLASDKGQRRTHPEWKRLEKIMVGKRRIEILQRGHDIRSGSKNEDGGSRLNTHGASPPCEMDSYPLAEALRGVIAREKVSFHMPGHRAGRGLPADLLSMLPGLDTTELPGTDNLQNPTGVIRAAEERAARFFGAKRTHFLVNGSTVGLLAMIQAAAGPGDALLVSRDCHQAVLHALRLAGVQPCFVETLRTGMNNLPCGPSAKALEQAVAQHPHARGLLVTRPNYYGTAVSLEAISKLLHERGMLLLVDEAHGAHFAAGPPFPATALASGADLVVQSLHKTLPAPTQTALLHEGRSWPGTRPRLPVSSLAEALSLFQTTSPSYPLLACIDAAVCWMAYQSPPAYGILMNRIGTFRQEMSSDGRFRLSGTGDTPPGFSMDPTRLVVTMENKGIELESWLRETHGIVAEMADRHRVVLITTPFHDEADFMLLSGALKQFPEGFSPHAGPSASGWIEDVEAQIFHEPESARAAYGGFHPGSVPESVMPLREAVCAPHEPVPLAQAAGRIAARSVTPYPPGIAVIVAGERYEPGCVDWLRDQAGAGTSLLGMEDGCVSCVVPV